VARILLVDDAQDQLDLISLALMRHGWQVEVASRADEALQRLKEREYDLVISHLGLPDQAATKMLQEARAAGRLASTAVMIVTGQANPENPDGFPVLQKPVDLDVLVRQVRSIFGLSAEAPAGTAAEGAPVELVLYYTPPWTSSLKALRNLETILAGFHQDAVHLTVRDLAEHPEDAETDGVVFSPTLVKKSPGPPVWMLGDLSDDRAVTDMLLSAGLNPRPAAPGG
jgi:DNA-binding response OmpR family regulator